MPEQAANARWILAMCRQFSCLPAALLAEDSALLGMLELEQLSTPPNVEE